MVGILIICIVKDVLCNVIDENGGDDELLIVVVEVVGVIDNLLDV